MASTPTPPPAPPGVGDALPPRRSGGSSSSSHHAAATATAEAPFDFDRFHALHFPGAMRELLAPTTVPGQPPSLLNPLRTVKAAVRGALALPVTTATTTTPFAALTAAHPGLEAFLAHSLPHFAECLLRRDVRPAEAPHVQRFLALVLRLCARHVPHDIEPLLALLCLLLGAPMAYGFASKWAPPGYAFAPEGFYQLHGRPLYRSAGGRALYAWPDEVEAAVPEEELSRGEAAIGRPVDVRMEGAWRAGLVVDFLPDRGLHTVVFIPPPETGPTAVVEEESRELCLAREEVRWLVTEAALYMPGAAAAGAEGSAAGGGVLVGTERLLYAPEDIGTRLKVWWGKDRVFYAGTVTAWDGATGKHTVTYDDGDLRDYDMHSKEYQLLALPPARRPPPPPQPVAQRNSSSSGGAGPLEDEEEGAHRSRSGLPCSAWIYARRPPASHAYGASCHLVHNINVFGALGGFRTLRDRLYACFEGTAQASDGGGAEAATTTDEEDNGDDEDDDADAPLEQPPAPSPPPPTHTRRRSCSSSTSGASSSGNSGSGSRDQLQRLPTLAVLRLHFTAIHALRARLEPAPLLEAVFHLKESLPALLLALGDGQLKQVAKADVREIPAMLQDLLSVTAAPRKEAVLAVETLQLDLACALFKTSQLEKRLCGLMHIKDAVGRVLKRTAHLQQQQQQQQLLPQGASAGGDSGGGGGGGTWWLGGGARGTSANGGGGRDRVLSASSGGGGGGGAVVGMDEAYLVRWLLRERVVEELFGASMHRELVTRADDVLHFLAARGQLGTAHLEAMWDATLGKHEAVALYALLADLVPHLVPPLRIFLFGRVAALPFHRYDAQTLDFVHAFTLRALRAARAANKLMRIGGGGGGGSSVGGGATDRAMSDDGSSTTGSLLNGGGGCGGGGGSFFPSLLLGGGDRGGGGGGSSNGSSVTSSNLQALNGFGAAGGNAKKGQVVHCPDREWFGFGLLWQYLQDDRDVGEGSTLPTELTAQAAALLVALLDEPECAGEREGLLRKCVQNLRAHRSVPASLLVLARTLAAYPSEKRGWFGSTSSSASSSWLTASPAARGASGAAIPAAGAMDAGGGGSNPLSGTAPSKSVGAVIEWLARTQGLWALLFEDLAYFQAKVQTLYGRGLRRGQAATEAFNGKRVRMDRARSRFTYLQELQARLDFLTFLLLHAPGSLRLEAAHLDTLWATLVDGALTQRAADLALDWLLRLASLSPEAAALTEHGLTDGSGRALFLFVDAAGAGGGVAGSGVSEAIVGAAATATGGGGGGGGGAGPNPILEDLGAIHEASGGLLGDGLLLALFQRKLKALPMERWRPAAARLFLQLFLYVNGKSRALKRAPQAGAGAAAVDGALGVSSTTTAAAAAASIPASGAADASPSAGGGGGGGGGGGALASWVRNGPRLEGLETLWELALDTPDADVADAAAALLIELHHRFSSKLRPKAEELRGAFAAYCLHRVRLALPALAAAADAEAEAGAASAAPSPDPSHPLTPPGTVVVPSSAASTPGDQRGGVAEREAMLKTEAQRVGRAVTILARFLDRFPGRPPRPQERLALADGLVPGQDAVVDVAVRAGKGEALALELTDVPLSVRVGEVRERVAAHFREPPERVLLSLCLRRPSGVAATAVPEERRLLLGRDGATLEEEVALPVLAAAEMPGAAADDMRVRPAVVLLARRAGDGGGPATPLTGGGVGVRAPWAARRASAGGHTAAVDVGQQAGSGRRPFPPELVAPSQLEGDAVAEGNLLLSSEHWLWASGTAADTPSSSSSSGPLVLPPPPLPHPPDAIVDDAEAAQPHARTLPLAAHFRAHPEQLDQLLALLELDAAVRRRLPLDVRAAVWAILQRLPTHPRVLGDLRSLAFFEAGRWAALFRERATYKLLYALQVLDALLTGPGAAAGAGAEEGAQKQQQQWRARFVHLGHLEQLTVALHLVAALAQELPAAASASSASLPGLMVATAEGAEAVHSEVVALCTALLCRALLAFLAPVSGAIGQGQEQEVARTAAALVATPRTVADAMDALIALAKARAKPSPAAFLSAVRHGVRLVAQACSAAAALAPPFVASPAAPAPPPTSLLGEYPRLPQWLAAFTLKVPARAARRAVAAALFQICEEEVSSAPSLRTPRRAPEVLPLLLRAMRPRLQQAAEVLAGGGGDSQSGMDGGGGEGSAVGAVAAAGAGAPVSISSSHEFLALLAALLQLALHPGRARESLSLLRHRALGLPPPPSSSTTSALSHSASLRLRQAQRDEAEEREGQRRLAGWGVDAQALCAEVGALLGRCDPALWLLPRRGVAEEAMGGVVLVALVLAQNSRARKAELTRPGRADVGRLYRAFLFPRPSSSSTTTVPAGAPPEEEEEEVETLGAMYLSGRMRGLLYGLLLELARGVPDNYLELLLSILASSSITTTTTTPLLLPRHVSSSFSAAAANGAGASLLLALEADPSSLLLPQPRQPHAQAQGLADEEVAQAVVARCRDALLVDGSLLGVEQVKWDYDPLSFIKDATQHVGLKNQGATCYMNSFLQQLFHIPDFRRGLLTLELDGAAKEPPPPPSSSSSQGQQQQQRGKKEEEKEGGSEKSLLLELQALFALLQTSERKSADTLAFCRTLTEGSGEPLLLHEQKDVDEFLTVLFAKLEALDPRMERLLKGLFEGTMVNQIISHECPHRSEREEPFPMLKVDVKNMGSLEDSLELYVAGELLSGDNKYACSVCGTKVEALRRTALRKLPPVLIIHLKRFEFDLESMTKFKVNDRCAFPMSLDMTPYTDEYLAAMEEVRDAAGTGAEGAAAGMTHFMSARGLGDSSAGLEVPPEDDEPAAGDDNTASGNKRAPMLGEMRPQGSGGPCHSMFRSGGSFGPPSAPAFGGASTPSGGGAAASALRSQGGGFLLPAGLPPRSDAYRYRLRGVVAHVGTTDSGHYYSFIRAPASSSSSSPSAAAAAAATTTAAAAAGGGGGGGAGGEDGDRWYEYNDQIVAPFDPADIPKECFGGVDRPPVAAAQGKGARGAATAGAPGGGNERVRNNNAYLLFYERVGGEEAGDKGDVHPHHSHQQQQQQQPPPQASPESARSASEENRGEGEEVGSPALSELRRFRQGVEQRAGSIASYVEGHGGGSKGRRPGPSGGGSGGLGKSPLSIAGSPAGAAVVEHHQGLQSGHLPGSVRRVVWSENMAFFRDRHLYAPAYHRFLWRLLQAEADIESLALASEAPAAAPAARLRAYAAGFRFLFEVVVHARAASCIPLWCDHLLALLRKDREQQDQDTNPNPFPRRRCALWTVLFLADDPDGRASAWQVLLACPHPAGRRGLLTLLAEAARDVHAMTEAAAAATAAAGGQGGVLGHAYMDLVPLSLPVVTAADGQQQQPQRQTLHLPRHPLARLAAWQLALLALAADADGGLGMPPPAVIPRPRQPSFSSPRSPNLHDPVYYAQSPYSTGGVTAAPLVAVTPELPRAVLGLALAGPGVCRLLRLLGAFARGAGLVASLHGGDNRHLATQPAVGEEVLGVTVTLLAALAEDSPPRELHATASLAGLASRRVVEAAALYYPRPAALLYSRFLAFAPEPSVPAAVLRALVERALDAGAMAGGSGGDAAGAQQYAGGRSAYQSAAAQQHAQQTQRRLLAAGARPLLSVLQAALSVGEDSGELQVFRLQQTLPLVERCTRLLSRRGASGGAGSGALPHELDLVYEVARMYMAVAAANPTAAAFVAAELGAPLTEWRRLLTGRQGGW